MSVLLLHGFTGSPGDLKAVASTLQKAGFACEIPLLPGHGTTPEDLNQTRVQAWIDASRDAFAKLEKTKPRFVVGLSMGALLATLLAAEFKQDVAGLVLISPAFALKRNAKLAVLLARLGLYHFVPVIQKSDGRDVANVRAGEENPGYPCLPLRALVEFDKVRVLAVKHLKDVCSPTYAAFGALDGTVDTDAASACLKHLKVPHLEQHFFDRSAHIVSIDFDKEELGRQILAFCESYA
jgi:carboxylesterase